MLVWAGCLALILGFDLHLHVCFRSLEHFSITEFIGMFASEVLGISLILHILLACLLQKSGAHL